MKLVKIIFNVAGVYGIAVLVPQYFLLDRIGQQSPPAITHSEYFYGFLGVALAWQFMFFVIARDPNRYRLAILPAILEKLSFGFVACWLYARGQLTIDLFTGGMFDLLFAALFTLSFMRTRDPRQG